MDYKVPMYVQHAVDMEIARALGYLSAVSGPTSSLGKLTKAQGQSIYDALMAAAELQRKERKINADR